MIIFPAIDLYDGMAVRLLRGDYAEMTVYDKDPMAVAKRFMEAGATHIHMVDLQGARDGETPNFETICRIAEETGLFCEAGGGIRTMETIEKYLKGGVNRVILGTAAVTQEGFAEEAAGRFGEKVAVGVDIKNGNVAIKGWRETSEYTYEQFFVKMKNAGVKTIICTDISKDGAMRGTNRELYKSLSEKFDIDIIASGGVSSIDDIEALAGMGLYGAIIGKAYYTGAIDLSEAVREGGEGK